MLENNRIIEYIVRIKDYSIIVKRIGMIVAIAGSMPARCVGFAREMWVARLLRYSRIKNKQK